jgi:hypothetical protein
VCMECWGIYQRTMLENQRIAMSMINFLQDEMDFVAGLQPMGPRIRVPMPTYVASAPVTMNTTNNIHVESGSQVGQINAGSIVYLDKVVTNLNGAGQKEFAATLQAFTQQVVDSKELSPNAQKEVLDLLRAVVEQLPKKKEERNPSIIKLALQNIGPLVTAGTAIAAHWDKLKQLLESVFHV